MRILLAPSPLFGPRIVYIDVDCFWISESNVLAFVDQPVPPRSIVFAYSVTKREQVLAFRIMHVVSIGNILELEESGRRPVLCTEIAIQYFYFFSKRWFARLHLGVWMIRKNNKLDIERFEWLMLAAAHTNEKNRQTSKKISRSYQRNRA